MVKALVTGTAGFVGNHLARLLLNEGVEVWGTVLNDREKLNEDIAGKVNILTCDIRDAVQIRSVLTACRPDYVFHLAAQSNVARSWDNPAETLEINVMGTINLLDEIVQQGSNPKILLAGSAEEYGSAASDRMPINESTPLNPANPYGSSKAAVSMLFRQYYIKYSLSVVYTRAFNHIGPGQTPGFVTVDFAKQVAEIEAGKREPVIMVGNLGAQRDFTDVRDVVKAYWAVIRRGVPGEVYNVGSGRTLAVQRVLDILLEKALVPIKIQRDQDRLRPSDVPVMVGDIAKIKAATGWEPLIPIEQSLVDILDYWRHKVNQVS